jgi:hypothetical protein
MDKDNLQFQVLNGFIQNLEDQSVEKYWASGNMIDKYKKMFGPFTLKSIAYVSRSPTLPLLLYEVIL